MPIGRPRTFDTDKALDSALKVFWKKGYEGASLPNLTKAMGINRPSLYAAFGNKESLFLKAVDRYIEGPARHVRAAFEERTARAVVERVMGASIDLVTKSGNPQGCFMIQSALVSGDTAEPIRREMMKRRCLLETMLRERFKRAVSEGDLPARCNTVDLARYFATVIQGIGVQAAGGKSRSELKKVAKMALIAWPK